MIELPSLPYAYDALSPTISEAALRLHHEKHHAKYVATVNDRVRGGGLSDASLESIIRAAAREADQPLLNNAGQAWNHGFFWVSMAPEARPPAGALAQRISGSFGSLEACREAFVAAGAQHFGSGWVWLVQAGETLAVRCTHDGGSLVGEDVRPLLVCDLWEHAYYLDHQNDRAGFLGAWFDRLANWDFAAAQAGAAPEGATSGWIYPSRAAPVQAGPDGAQQGRDIAERLDRLGRERGQDSSGANTHWSPTLFG